MTDPISNCAKCNAKMEEGFIVDYGHAECTHVASWVDGPPEQATLFGLKNGFKIAGKRQIPARAFRCTSCGYLEFYAK